MSAQVDLASITKELKEQPSLLKSFQQSATWQGMQKAHGDAMLVGAGDSYAASICVSLMAGPRVAALDPYSLAESVEWARRRPVYIISISGQTMSNVELAGALKGIAAKRVAITCNPQSRLAEAVDEVIQLPFKPLPKSPGIATFSLSLAAALKVCGLDPTCDFDSVFSCAVAESRRIRISDGPNVTHFTGNNEAYGASIYGVAKIYELLGGRAQASLLEEFSHMPLFSLRPSDSVNVIRSATGWKAERLCEKLKAEGYSASLISPKGESRIERLYLLIFAMQVAAVRAAKRRGLKSPRFLAEKEKLRISDEMIY